MFLMTQDRSKIINIDRYLYEADVVGKHLFIRRDNFGARKPKTEFIGTYETEKRAMEVFDSLSESISSNYNNRSMVYKLPEK